MEEKEKTNEKNLNGGGEKEKEEKKKKNNDENDEIKTRQEESEFEKEEKELKEKDKELKEKEEIIEELEEQIDILESEKEDFLKNLQRLQAEFSNYRRRVGKEKAKIKDQAVADVVFDLLPVLDNFERALGLFEGEDDFNQGVKMIYKQLLNFMEQLNVKEIAALGEEFDHNYHDAVMQVDDKEHESGTIIEVIQKGYIMEDKVIRPAMVKVAA